MRRRLTVILASDVAGYSRLVAADEEDTVHRFQIAATAFADLVKTHRGRVFNTAGDAILAEFESAVDATRCAIDIQAANNAQNVSMQAERKLLFRIGIAIGDVLVAETGDLLGDAVNIAARLEGIAEPGGICISDEVRVHVVDKIRPGVVDLGEQSLRNIPRPVRAFRLLPDRQDAQAPRAKPARRRAAWMPIVWLTSAVAVAAVAAAAVLIQRPASPTVTSGNAEPAFDVAGIPLVTDRIRGGLSNYLQEPDFKAIALSRIGWGMASGAQDAAGAERDALDRCKKRDQKGDCRIYAVGPKVVWRPSPLPLPADLRTELADLPLVPADIAGIKGVPAGPALEAYLKEDSHKALAVSETGYSSMGDRADKAEAIRLAVERCSDFAQAPCLLLSVDGLMTVKIPHAHKAVRPYTLAGETEMSDADKQRIARIYGGRDWRALAKGGSNGWYAVGDMESETAAADAVLKACHDVEPQCALRAIGNFRVDERP